jgi:alkylation response protein AidB-like acyl-CoA dehydrogenase
MANFFKDNDDLRFYFERGFDWPATAEMVEQRYRLEDGFASAAEATEFYREVVEMVGEFVAEEIAPVAADIDRQGLTCEDGEVRFPKELDRIFKKIKGLDIHGMCLPRELGGLNCPAALYMICTELFARADVSVCAHHGFHGGMAMAMLFYSLSEGSTEVDREKGTVISTRFADAIAEIVAGEAWGSMDLTEAGAGSDLAALRAKGELDADGTWRVTGEKIFITSGHAKYHFVLARTEARGAEDDPMAGLGGLSLFLVPAYEGKGANKKWIARVERIEEKLGHHGSATVAITFDRAPGHLVGARGEGFKQMLLLMNNARVGVGFESIGLCEAALRMAQDYAAERPSMGKTIDQHEMIADYLDTMENEIQGLRALAMYAAFHEEMAQRSTIAARYYAEDGSDEKARFEAEARRHKAKARRVTPLLKYLASEKAVEHARLNIQIHGGVGYTKEYGAEKLLRDAMVMPIYEGTSQIQALMAMKDALMGVMKNPQGFVARAAQARWRAVSARDPLERGVARLQTQLNGATQHLMQRTAADKLKALGGKPITAWPDQFLRNWDPKRDFAYAMLHAERLTQLMADVVIAERLWGQARQFPERRPVLERWLERAEPRARFLHEQITTTGGRLLAKLRATQDAAQAEAG